MAMRAYRPGADMPELGRFEPASKASYERLRAQGKPHKVVLVAVMRKLVSLLTALLRQDRLWQREAPAAETAA